MAWTPFRPGQTGTVGHPRGNFAFWTSSLRLPVGTSVPGSDVTVGTTTFVVDFFTPCAKLYILLMKGT